MSYHLTFSRLGDRWMAAQFIALPVYGSISISTDIPIALQTAAQWLSVPWSTCVCGCEASWELCFTWPYTVRTMSWWIFIDCVKCDYHNVVSSHSVPSFMDQLACVQWERMWLCGQDQNYDKIYEWDRCEYECECGRFKVSYFSHVTCCDYEVFTLKLADQNFY
jgi:hypothetical protein